MKYLAFLLLAHTLFSQEKTPPPNIAQVLSNPAVATATNSKSVIIINAKERASDFIQAFNLLRKEKPTLKISIRTTNELLSNVTEISNSQNGTLFFIKLLTPQGPKVQVIPIEDLVEISHAS